MVLSGLLALLQLRGHRRYTLLAPCNDLDRQGLAIDASWSVIAGAVGSGGVYGRVVNDCICHRAVIDVNVGDGNVVDGTIVIETPPAPISTLIPNAYVAKSIVNAAVEADMLAPGAIVVAISAG